MGWSGGGMVKTLSYKAKKKRYQLVIGSHEYVLEDGIDVEGV